MTFKAIAQLFVLGCSWGLGYFMVEEMGETVGSVMAYLFTIVNVLQGLLLFVMHCLLNRQVRPLMPSLSACKRTMVHPYLLL